LNLTSVLSTSEKWRNEVVLFLPHPRDR
jgi:hypothetical protein